MTRAEDGRTTGRSEPSDEDLMGRLAAGQRDALGPLHGRYAALIFHIAARSLGPEAAEEIVQDVFVAVWRKAAAFDPSRGNFRSWALRIAHLRVLNELRRRGRRPRGEADPDGAHVGNVPEPGPGPEESAWLDHRRAIVRAAVEALPPPQRRALSLAFLDDLSHQQVADFLDLPLGTAKTRIRTALRSLRVRLAPLLAAGLLVVVLLAGVLVRERWWASRLRRDEAALRLVTSSDVVPLRLSAAPGVPAESHGQYRHRPGVAMAVLTVSHIRPAPPGAAYQAWGRFDGHWRRLGPVRPDPAGSALVVFEGPHLAATPSALMLTPEAVDGPTAPTGPPVILWPSP